MPGRDGSGRPAGSRDCGEDVQGLATALRNAQLVVFSLLAASATWQYLRRRATPARHLAVAFGVLAGGLAAARVAALLDGRAAEALVLVAVIAVVSFPWLLAAFAWSFEGRLPRWLRLSWVAVAAVAALYVLADPGATPGGDRDGDDIVFLVGFLIAWLVPSVATAARLLAAGGSNSRIVRARMRLFGLVADRAQSRPDRVHHGNPR